MGESATTSYSSSPSGYGIGPPWLFRGRALYQLHLVKAEIARAFIPKELKLVEAFGYTLGGLFLAHYDDSPAGVFDELVVIAGIVWNPPTSCAWASRVLVNSHEACRHGRKEIGLPSHVAIFAKVKMQAISNLHGWHKVLVGKEMFIDLNEQRGFILEGSDCLAVSVFDAFVLIQAVIFLLNRDAKASDQPLYKHRTSFIHSKPKEHSEIQVLEMEDYSQTSICNISLPFAGDHWMGPKIRISLPSFSGQTIHNPQLLKYSCQIECRVRAVKSAKVSRPRIIQLDEFSNDIRAKEKNVDDRLSTENEERDRSIAVLLSKPIMALEFNLLKMQVEAPTVVAT